MSVQEILNEHYERAKAGGVNYENYKDDCPLKTSVCDRADCTACRYYIPPPTAPELPEVEAICFQCGGKSLSKVENWRANTRVGTTDGIHEFYDPGDQWYTRMLCGECGLITDFRIEAAPDDPPDAAVAAYAHPVRELHADLQQGLSDLTEKVNTLTELVGLLLMQMDEE